MYSICAQLCHISPPGSNNLPHYQYDVSISRQKRFIRKFKKLLLVIFGVIILIGIVIGIDATRQNLHHDTEVGQPSVTTVHPSIREFDTPYFTFNAPTGWTNVDSESATHKFDFKSYRGTLIEQELTVYVDDPTADLTGTYALPVKIGTDQRIIPTQVTDHCNTVSAIKKANAPVVVTIMQTKISCLLDGTNYVVIVGEKDGDANIKLKRPNGRIATYNFVYRSSTVPPDSLPLVNILNTFTPL